MSGKGLTPNETARFEQSFVIGLSRSTPPEVACLTGAAEPSLAALALIAQQKRFPSRKPSLADTHPVLPDDQRPVIPQDARPILRRILSGADGNASDSIAQASALALRERGFRYHPFDLLWLHKHLWHLRTFGDLGPTERFWLNRRGGTTADGFESLEITDDNWTEFKKAEREAFLTRRRQADPAAARTLLATRFSNETANVREGLLSALRVGIGPDDREFLDGLAGDRAKSVRDKAEALLGEISGTPQYAARREAALLRIKVKQSGLIARKTKLSYGASARKGNLVSRAEDAKREIGGIALTDIAKHAGCSVEQLLPAAIDDYPLYSVLLATAAAEDRWPLLLDWAGGKNGESADILPAIRDPLMALPVERRREIVRAVMERVEFAELADCHALPVLLTVFEGPLDEASATRLLSGRGWKSLIAALNSDKAGPTDSVALQAAAALLPSSLVSQFSAAINHLPRDIALRPTLYHRFVAALDAQDSPQKQDPTP